MKRFIIKIMEFLTLFYAVMLVGTIIVDCIRSGFHRDGN